MYVSKQYCSFFDNVSSNPQTNWELKYWHYIVIGNKCFYALLDDLLYSDNLKTTQVQARLLWKTPKPLLFTSTVEHENHTQKYN